MGTDLFGQNNQENEGAKSTKSQRAAVPAAPPKNAIDSPAQALPPAPAKRQYTPYSEALAEAFCEEIATTTTGLREICSRPGMPAISTIMYWQRNVPEFASAYRIALEMRGTLEADEIREIAKGDGEGDDLVKVARDKLRVDAQKWLASKHYPRVYGTQVDVTHRTEERKELTPDQFSQLLVEVGKKVRPEIEQPYTDFEEV
jgi:hypothetical protein